MSPSAFSKFIAKYTKPYPEHACPTCETWGLRRYTAPGKPERVVCLNQRCPDYEHLEGMPAPA